jgi:hypothetical protein
MSKLSTVAIIMLITQLTAAQTTLEEHRDLTVLADRISALQKENTALAARLSVAEKDIDSLRSQVRNGNIVMNQLGQRIEATETDAIQKLSAMDQLLSASTLYGVAGLAILLLLTMLIYTFLSQRQKFDRVQIFEQLGQTKSSIEESLVRQFDKQTGLLETQLFLLDKEHDMSTEAQPFEPDHSLALKVASEINLIERNIGLMDPGTKGLKQLVRSVEKLRDNLAANGYEIPELLGKPFHQGMKVIVANSIPDENLEKGSETITKILIPQVNYNDKMIQTAQIEVSVGI